MKLAEIEQLNVDEKLALIDAIHDSFGADGEAVPHQCRKMSIDERLDLCGRIQDTIVPQDYPLPEWQIRKVETELAAYRRDGIRGRPAEEVLEDIRKNP